MPEICGEVLYDENGHPEFVCKEPYGTEHSHHDEPKMDRIYFDPEDEQRDGKGWNVVESGGAIALRYATKTEAEAYVAQVKNGDV